ncbi:MAG: AbrB/MazE/SpoVT family DNA-binding domain-containing protein [Deltaproteobacteria bacterium]|nr:AbrB/MazE/SpoVT family DNA-binding domain-containing protein [Deltaproteobacteria bacterium]
MKSAVSSKGQVIIPKPLRDRLGIRAGTVLDFAEKNGRLVARKADPTDPVTSVYGILSLGRSTDAVLVELRGDPGDT